MHTFGTVYAALCVSLASLWFLWRLLALIGRRGRTGGSGRPSAYTSTREPGTTTQATGTLAASSSCSAPGIASESTELDRWLQLAKPPSESNYFRHGLSTGVTEAPGESGGPLVPAACARCSCDRLLHGGAIVQRNPDCPLHGDHGTDVFRHISAVLGRPWPSWAA